MIIKNLDPDKADGHDMISIRMIKFCGISICKPLAIIFKIDYVRANFLPNGERQMLSQHLKKVANSV